jgi:hypothetical protein
VATDPIQAVREREPATPYDLDARRALLELAALPPSLAAPYLTVSLDWRPAGEEPGRAPAPEPLRSQRHAARDEQGPSRRPARQQLERQLEELVGSLGPRGTAFDSASADAARILDFLDSALDPAAHGVFIVACDAAGVFRPLTLGLPLPTRLQAGPTPALGALARLVEDHPTYAVLLADQRDATLFLIDQATARERLEVEGSGYPRKQQQGGWSQRRYQARADERVAAFARGVAAEVRRTLDDEAVDTLIVAGDEVITSALDAEFHDTVKARIVATIRLAMEATEHEVIEATLPIAQQAEREREEADVRRLRDAVGAAGQGAAGAEDTLTALQAGQVQTLLMVDDFAAPGWADFSLPVSGVGDLPAQHPAGGDPDNLVPVALEEELIRLALQAGGAVQIVHTAVPVEETLADGEIPDAGAAPPRTAPALALDALGGVGALLRFALDEDRPVAEL